MPSRTKSYKQCCIEMQQTNGTHDSTCFKRGDLGLIVAPMLAIGKKSGVDEALVKFLEDSRSDIKLATLHKYRQICHLYPKGLRGIASFQAHEVLRNHPNKYELVKQPLNRKEAQAIMGIVSPEYVRESNDPYQLAKTAERFLRVALTRIETEPITDHRMYKFLICLQNCESLTAALAGASGALVA